jgi:MarC family membrane protein
MSIIKAAILLFLVMDPIGNIPFFLSALKSVDQKRRRKVIIRELCIALGILVFFLFLGEYVLALLQIEEPSLSIAGGIILFLIAIKMIFPSSKDAHDSGCQGEPFIVPLAVPLVAGPSALATVLLLSTRETSHIPGWLVALTAAWIASAVILLFSDRFSRILGPRVLTAVEKLMGMLLTAVAVQMFMTGIKEFLNR